MCAAECENEVRKTLYPRRRTGAQGAGRGGGQ